MSGDDMQYIFTLNKLEVKRRKRCQCLGGKHIIPRNWVICARHVLWTRSINTDCLYINTHTHTHTTCMVTGMTMNKRLSVHNILHSDETESI